MSKGIELTPTQIKAYENGASMFLFPITKEISADYTYQGFSSGVDEIWRANFWNQDLKDIIFVDLPTQKGDKDIFVQEEFAIITDYCSCTFSCNCEPEHTIIYKNNYDLNSTSLGLLFPSNADKIRNAEWQPASQMTKEQSRYSFSECVDVRVVRVQEINIKDIPKIQTEMWMFDDWYNQQMKEQNINRTYEDNDYVFLVEFKR